MNLTRGRTGVSKLAVAVALVVVLVVAGAYVFLARSSTTTSQSSSATSPTVPVRSAVDRFIKDINDRNVDGLGTFYNQNSVTHWSGNTGGLSGLYTGTENIKLTYATSVGKTSKMDVNSSNYAENKLSATHINATFVLLMLANSSTVGNINATIGVSQEWNWGSGGWQISRENWDYTFFYASELQKKYGPVTTFPQWTVMEMGGNPDLVSEKSFEWHAGPFLAAGVYAFLFTIVIVLGVKFRSRDRGSRPERRRRPTVT